MLMTRIGAPFALVDGSHCHLYTLNLAQSIFWLLPSAN